MYFANKQKNSREYFVASRGLGASLIIVLLFAELVGPSSTIGNATLAFNIGFSSVWAVWGMALGCITFVFLVAKFYRAVGVVKGAVSVPESYAVLFDQRSRLVMLLNVVVVYFIFFATFPVAAVSVLKPVLNINENIILWGIMSYFILLTVTSGMRGIAKMNILHASILYIGITVVALKALSTVGGLSVLRENLPPTFFTFTQPNTLTVVAHGMGAAIGFWASANVVQDTFCAKSMKDATVGIIGAGLLIVPFALMPAIIGMCARLTMPEIDPRTAIFAMANSLGGFYGGVISMATIAAVVSSAPSVLLIITTTLTKDFYKGILFPKCSDREQLIVSWIMAIVIAPIATWCGLHGGPIMHQFMGALQIRSVVGIVLIAALYWPRVTSDAAFYSMLIGGIVAAVWHFAQSPFGIAPLWPAAFVCLVILIPLSLIQSKGKVADSYKIYHGMLDTMNKGMYDKSN